MLFTGEEVQTNTSAGIIVSNQSLVLQKVDLRNRGRYTCTATNAQGVGESKPIMLKVRCEYYYIRVYTYINVCVCIEQRIPIAMVAT